MSAITQNQMFLFEPTNPAWTTLVSQTISGIVGIVLGLLLGALTKVSKKDFTDFRTDVHDRLAGIDSKMAESVTRTELKTELVDMRSQLGGDLKELRVLIQDVLREQRKV